MATTSPNLGLTIWNAAGDSFNYTQLANNWTLIDNQFAGTSVSTVPVRFVESLSAVPGSNLTQGRLIYLTAANSGFAANELLVYNGTFWQTVGPLEVQATLPTQSNYQGRRITLSAATGPFQAFDTIVNTDGANTWKRIDNDTLLSIATFRALASVPDGLRCLVQIDSGNGINWNFRNNSNSGSSYTFEAVGSQVAYTNEIDAFQTITAVSGTFTDLGTVGPSLTVPLSGEYEIRGGATFIPTQPVQAWLGINNNGSIVSPILTPGFVSITGEQSRYSFTMPRLALTRGTMIKLQYRVDSNGGYSWSQRVLQIIPLRVNQT